MQLRAFFHKITFVHKLVHIDFHCMQHIDIYVILLMHVYCKSVYTGSIPVPASNKIKHLAAFFLTIFSYTVDTQFSVYV